MANTRKVMAALETLKKGGLVKVPPELEAYVKNQDRKDRGVVQVWECDKCPYEYESFVKILSTAHECAGLKQKGSHALKLSWEA